MRIPLTFLLFVGAAIVSLAADIPPSATVTKSQDGALELIKSIRTNGCTLELRRYTKSKPYLQGYWVQGVFIGDARVVQIQHSATEKEQSLAIAPATGWGVLQLDRDLDGKYEMLLVVSVEDESLKDVLYVTADGWLRHATPEEFQARLRVAERNRDAIQKVDKIIRDGLN
jgi:hypothetical protein